MGDEEKDILVRKRKYWTKLMKYNLVGTIFLVILMFLMAITIGNSCDGKVSEVGVGCNLVLILLLFFYFFLFISWPLSFIIYGYQSFKIYKITKPKVLAKSSGISLHNTQKHKEGLDEDKITKLKGIAELRDSGGFTEREFLEHKSRILNEMHSQIDEDKITKLKGIVELRDSGGFTEREFLEHKSRILNEMHSQTDEDLNSKNYNRYITGGGLVSRVSRRPVHALAIICAIICAIILAILIFNDGDYETPQNVYLDMEICYDVVYNQTNYTYAYSYNYKKGNGDKNETNGTMTNQTGPMCILFTELVYLNGTMSFNAGSHCDYDCQGRVQIFTYGDNSGGIAVKGEREACEWQAGNIGLLHVSCRSSYKPPILW